MAVKVVLILLVCCVESFMLQPFQVDSFMTESFDYASQNNQDFREGHVVVQSADPDQEAWLRQPQKYSVFCGKDAVEIVLPSGPLSEVKIWGMYAVWLLHSFLLLSAEYIAGSLSCVFLIFCQGPPFWTRF